MSGAAASAASAASAAAARGRALGLYRRILRAHALRLPADMRRLGDAYVREEFARHKAAPARFLGAFFSEWERYAAAAEASDASGSAAVVAGADLPADAAQALSTEQRATLDKLREEAQQAAGAVQTGAAGGATGGGGGGALR